MTPEVLDERRRQADAAADAIPDAFSPVRGLISGPTAIVTPAMYEHYRGVQARVVSAVAAVRATRPWAFLCLAGAEYGAPRLVWLADTQAEPLTGLEPVCDALRDALGSAAAQRSFDDAAAAQLTSALDHLNTVEERMLPRKKQRTLDELRDLLQYFGVGQSPRRGRKHRALDAVGEGWREAAEALAHLLNGERVREGRDGSRVMVDLGVIADRSLALLRPAWLKVGVENRRRILLLKDLRQYLRQNPPTAEELEELLAEEGLWAQPLDERVVAAIVGVVDSG